MIIFQFLYFYFVESPQFILKVWKNYLVFNLNYFSISFLLKTLFAHWRKYRWYYPKRFDVKQFFSALVSNLISRFLGAILRIFLIIIGLIVEVIILFLGIIILLLWLILPVLLVVGFVEGFNLLFK